MSSPSNKEQSLPQRSLRDTLFADESLERVAKSANEVKDSPPWSHFFNAQQSLMKNEKNAAIQELKRVLEMAGVESRVTLQTWHCLRELCEFPPADVARQIQGVVVEVALERGLDLLAAYADHTTRYFNFSGAGVISDASDPEIEKITDQLLGIGQGIINHIGVWDKPRPPAPPSGSVRINLLTCGGLYFGQGEFEVLARDSLGGPALQAASNLMQVLIAKSATQRPA